MEDKSKILKQVFTFLLITSTLTAGLFVWIFSSPDAGIGMYIGMMLVPGISAFLTTFLYKENIREYGWKLGKVRYLGYSYALPIIASIVGYGFVWMAGLADVFFEGVQNYKWARMLGFETPVPVVVGILSKMSAGFVLTFIVVVGEEVGWTGFLTAKLSKIYSIPVTSIIVGGYWALWHYPAIIGGIYGYGTPLWVALPGFTLVIVSASFLRTVLRFKSGSIWVGVVLHTSHNVFLMGIFHDLTVKKGYASYLVSETGVFLGLVYLVVAVVFWKGQMRSGMVPPSPIQSNDTK